MLSVRRDRFGPNDSTESMAEVLTSPEAGRVSAPFRCLLPVSKGEAELKRRIRGPGLGRDDVEDTRDGLDAFAIAVRPSQS
jgi:hypothetical protein